MSKKRAFVRYTKSGEIVPGSLIITTNGGYPDKSSLWKEVTTNECCDGGGCDFPAVVLSKTVTAAFPVNTNAGCFPVCNVETSCGNIFSIDIQDFAVLPNNCTLEQYVELLNTWFSWVGLWSLTGTTVSIDFSGYLAKALCPNGVLTMNISVACPA